MYCHVHPALVVKCWSQFVSMVCKGCRWFCCSTQLHLSIRPFPPGATAPSALCETSPFCHVPQCVLMVHLLCQCPVFNCPVLTGARGSSSRELQPWGNRAASSLVQTKAWGPWQYGNSLGEGQGSCKLKWFCFQTVRMTQIIDCFRKMRAVLSLVESVNKRWPSILRHLSSLWCLQVLGNYVEVCLASFFPKRIFQ